MAIQTPLSQEALIAQALGQSAAGAPGAIPGQAGIAPPTGLPGVPALDPQLIGQALAQPDPLVNPAQVAGTADSLVGPGSFGDYLRQMRDYRACIMDGGANCVAPAQPGGGAPGPGGTLGVPPMGI